MASALLFRRGTPVIKVREPLRVCHFVSGDAWGGLEAMVLSLLRAQHADPAYEVSLIALNDGRLYREAMAEGITVHLLPEHELNAWQLVRRLRRVLTSLRAQLLHTHRYKENFFSYLVAPGLGIRPVVTLHAYGPSSFTPAGIKTFVRDSISFRLARRAHTQFVAVSRDLQRLYRPKDDECITIPNGVATTVASPRQRENGDPRLVIGWVGRLVPIKSVGTLLEALTHMGADRGQPTALLVGDGPERAALTEHAKRLGIQHRVQFAGYVEDLSPFLARMDVFALPSLHEGAPMALLEAMAAGVPGVAARVGGIPEMIGESGAVRLVDGHDPVVWAREIESILADRAATDEMARRARRLVSERFSVDAMHTRYGELYHALVTC
jgi:glycosyltransferase involved in cell wall biosynthesis